MMNKLFIAISIICASNLLVHTSCSQQPQKTPVVAAKPNEGSNKKIIIGAEQLERYLPLLKNKNVGLVVNHTSVIGNTHLVDSLISLNIKVKKIFAPEHGFRGKADAGETVNNEVDKKTGLPIISLYGNNKKPSTQHLKDLDILIFDIQDIGVRFYTYIGTMHYIMQACAENNKELIILDRPNPNGHYVDGPILEIANKSFVGMHAVPLVHGLTVAEYAQMINGEKWLDSSKVCKLHLISIKNYTHKDRYSIAIKPSPNIPNDVAVNLYPSLGLFEGTTMSVGRGTEFPFQVVGAPNKAYGDFSFTPVSIEGMAKNPPYQDQICYGIDLRKSSLDERFTLKYVIDFYNKSPDKEKYFNSFLTKLIGNTTLKEQIKKGLSEQEIKQSWAVGLNAYKTKRKKYLLYPDFE